MSTKLSLILFIWAICDQIFAVAEEKSFKPDTVVVAILARNKAHILPYFLTALQNLDYPKHRIKLWVRSDHNIDETVEVLQKWISTVQDQYHSINAILDKDSVGYADEVNEADWSPFRFENVIRLRQEALQFARDVWADYLLMLDCDVILTEPSTLTRLISKQLTLIAPMLNSEGMYSNFWHGMTEDGYYMRTENYEKVLHREIEGCHVVPMIHSCILFSLRQQNSDHLSYLPKEGEPHDDMLTLAKSAHSSGVNMHVCNDVEYGWVTAPLESDEPPERDLWRLTNIQMEVLKDEDSQPLPIDPIFKSEVVSKPDTLGFDEIFIINLKRREARRRRMVTCLENLSLKADFIDAVDGRALNGTGVLENINFMPGYSDPYRGRPMTLGEVGCFLSHYKIWQTIFDKNMKAGLILEDDIRFEPYFRQRTEQLLKELQQMNSDSWDLVYLGRKRLQDDVDEPWFEGSKQIVHATYSYWTLGYILSATGAKKLLEARPLENLLPVDEFLPIMYDHHPRDDWAKFYPVRNLIGLSVHPLLLYPTHYTGEKGYISDTEDSTLATSTPKEDL